MVEAKIDVFLGYKQITQRKRGIHVDCPSVIQAEMKNN